MYSFDACYHCNTTGQLDKQADESGSADVAEGTVYIIFCMHDYYNDNCRWCYYSTTDGSISVM